MSSTGLSPSLGVLKKGLHTGLADKVVFSHRLDSVISEIFSNLKDVVIL